MKRGQVLVLISLAVLACVVFCVLGYILVSTSPDTAILPPTPTAESQTIETAEGYVFPVPGNAFLDGRDLEAQPPLTVMNINIWGEVPRLKAVCNLQHGSEVQLLKAQYYEPEARYYFLVKGGNCRGWLSENFLSTEKHAPVGDQF